MESFGKRQRERQKREKREQKLARRRDRSVPRTVPVEARPPLHGNGAPAVPAPPPSTRTEESSR